MRIETRHRARLACQIFILFSVLNFGAFAAATHFLGGDAINGKVEGGHYYLWGDPLGGGPKGFTEVSKGVYYFSLWHVLISCSTGPLALAAYFFMPGRAEGLSEH